jgi:hypothetical protein
VTYLSVHGDPLETWGEPETPTGFVWRNTPHHILEVTNQWRIHTCWWEPSKAVWREYLKVVTDTGLLCLIFRDLMHDGWFLARLYD